MASIITEKFRKTLAQFIESDQSESTYYIGLGKSDSWNEALSNGLSSPFPIGTSADCEHVLTQLTDLIKVGISDFGRVIPLVKISANSYYKQYNPYDASSLYSSTVNETEYKPAYFVDETGGNIYIIVYSPPGVPLSLNNTDRTNLVNGDDGNGNEMFALNSGHIVVKVGSFELYSKFNSEQFVKINTDLPEGAAIDEIPYKGVVYGLHVANGGEYDTDASSLPGTVDIYGVSAANGETIDIKNESVTCTLSGGVITSVKLDSTYYDDLIIDDLGPAFKNAIVQISIDGVTKLSDPTIYPCISNINGFAYDITEYTPAWYECFLADSRSSIHDVYSKYSQISLIRNPEIDGEAPPSSDSISTKKSFNISPYVINIDASAAIVQRIASTDKYIGVLDSYNASDSTVYYTSSPKYGFDTPTEDEGQIVFVVDGVETLTSQQPTNVSSTNVTGGDVLFIDNRAAVVRSEDQNEELKIIIQL